jgi:hypothetical protein
MCTLRVDAAIYEYRINQVLSVASLRLTKTTWWQL